MQIYIVPLDFTDEILLDKLSESLNQVFKIPIKILPIEVPLKKGWSLERNQLNSNWVLSQLLTSVPDEKSKIIGITVYDLYIPILTYLFGEAELGGRAAVFSIYRFQDELYGLPVHKENLMARMIKEAIHELGHTFGLRHCSSFDCVMHSSTYIEEFDFKTENFCTDCNLQLKENMKV